MPEKEDWELTDEELLLQMRRFLGSSDPFNGRRARDIELGDFILHAADRIRAIRSISLHNKNKITD